MAQQTKSDLPVDHDRAPPFRISSLSSQRIRDGVADDCERPQGFIRSGTSGKNGHGVCCNAEPEKTHVFSQRLLR
jgi:hypothetical protein